MTLTWLCFHETNFAKEEWNVVVVDDMKADKEKHNPANFESIIAIQLINVFHFKINLIKVIGK